MPVLKPDTFDRQLASKRLAPIYLLWGSDTELIERAVVAIEQTVDEADRAFAVERVYAGEAGGAPIDIVSSARIFPMLGDRRIVTVLRAERLLKPKRAGSSPESDDEEPAGDAGDAAAAVADATPLEDYLAAPVDSTTLVFAASDIDRSRRLTKRLLEAASVVEYAGLGQPGKGPRDFLAAAVAIVEAELGAAGRTLDRPAMRLLVERSGGEVGKLRGDIEKLVLFAGPRTKLTADDVDAVAADPNAVTDDWAVVNAIGSRNPALALLETGRRFDRGDSAHALVGQLRWWVSTRLVTTEPKRVKPALAALLRTDLALKSSGGDDRVLVERLVVELTG